MSWVLASSDQSPGSDTKDAAKTTAAIVLMFKSLTFQGGYEPHSMVRLYSKYILYVYFCDLIL